MLLVVASKINVTRALATLTVPRQSGEGWSSPSDGSLLFKRGMKLFCRWLFLLTKPRGHSYTGHWTFSCHCKPMFSMRPRAREPEICSAVLILVSHFQGIAGADGLPGDKGELVGVLKFSRLDSSNNRWVQRTTYQELMWSVRINRLRAPTLLTAIRRQRKPFHHRIHGVRQLLSSGGAR